MILSSDARRDNACVVSTKHDHSGYSPFGLMEQTTHALSLQNTTILAFRPMRLMQQTTITTVPVIQRF